MYLASRPIVDNPLIPPSSVIFGQWPFYIIIFQLALLSHALVVNVPFGFIKENPTRETTNNTFISSNLFCHKLSTNYK